MANAVWPATLPAPLSDSVSYGDAGNNIIESQVEIGPPKRRPRATYMPETFTGAVLLNHVQVATMRSFYGDVLKQIMPFDWRDFRTGEGMSYVFTARPGYVYVPDSKSIIHPYGLWKASLALETR